MRAQGQVVLIRQASAEWKLGHAIHLCMKLIKLVLFESDVDFSILGFRPRVVEGRLAYFFPLCCSFSLMHLCNAELSQ
jgi:hypothetical protein